MQTLVATLLRLLNSIDDQAPRGDKTKLIDWPDIPVTTTFNRLLYLFKYSLLTLEIWMLPQPFPGDLRRSYCVWLIGRENHLRGYISHWGSNVGRHSGLSKDQRTLSLSTQPKS
jgi:hypothetical protein